MNTFHSELLSNSKEGVEVILGDVDLTMVHEVEHALHVPVGDSLQVEHQGTLLAGRLVSSQDRTEERTACREDHLVNDDIIENEKSTLIRRSTLLYPCLSLNDAETEMTEMINTKSQ